MAASGEPLRWAIVGTGFISHTMIDAIAASPGSEVAVIAGRNPDKLVEFGARHDVAHTTVDFDAVYIDPDIDVVYIGLPNHAHHDAVIAASAAGKAVLSEKSLTTTMETAQQLAAAVRTNNTFFVEGLMYLAHPLFRKVTELLLDGRLGQLRSVHGSYAADIDHLANPLGKGTLYNLGCYPASLLHLVMQTMAGDDAFADRQLTAVGSTSPNGNVIDAAMAVRFGNGVVATLQSSDTYGNASAFAVSGDDGTLRFVTNPWLPVAGPNVLEWKPFDGEAETIVVHDDHDAFFHQVQLVERCLATGHTEAERPSPRLEDSLEIMALLTEWEAACLPTTEHAQSV